MSEQAAVPDFLKPHMVKEQQGDHTVMVLPRHLTKYTVATMRVRDPNAPLSEPEKAVFGVDARLHPITGMPLEKGCTDHARGDGLPPSDNAQAAGHFGVMINQLNKLCAQYRAETDYFQERSIGTRSHSDGRACCQGRRRSCRCRNHRKELDNSAAMKTNDSILFPYQRLM
jgi:hypothetical protein